MESLDHALTQLGGGSIALALLAAFLLGLRHATDPDHLTAVSTLVLGEGGAGSRRSATGLGLAWGLGHATTLLLLGLPVVLLGSAIPEAVSTAAELAIGAVIVGLAVRLLVRWRRGSLHVHEHSHGDLRHAHPHVHEHGAGQEHGYAHQHAHAGDLGRSPAAAYGIGLVHGVGGSAGVGILLVGGVSGGAAAAAALVLFAAATAASMALASSLFGAALSQGPMLRRFEQLVPVLGTLSLLFGVWYGLGAAGSAM